MKTQILRLEPHDDVISARDKMGWNQTGRILLVWPERGKILTRRLDLLLLQRHSFLLGAQLALITRDPDVRFNAKQLSIPVYKNLNQAQRSHWRTQRRTRPRLRRFTHRKPIPPSDLRALRDQANPPPPAWMSSPITRIGFFCLGVLAILSIAAILLPGANVDINPQIRNQVISLDVRANPALESINLSGAIPATSVTTIVQGSAAVPTHGTAQIPDQSATGLVSFNNLTDGPVTIPKGSIVRTEGEEPVRFMVTQSGVVPSGTSGTAMLPVRALLPGTGGNRPGGSLIIIEGPLGTKLAVTNPTDTKGGTNRSVPAPTASERLELYNQLVADLSKQAIQGLEKMVSPGDLLLTPTLTVTQVLRKNYDPAGEQPADELQLDLQLEFQAYKASSDDLNGLASSVLDANIPAGFVPVPGSLGVKNISKPVFASDQLVHWDLQAQRQIQVVVPKTRVISLIVGLPTDLAFQRLNDGFPLQSPPRIRLTPDWWPRMPFLPFRISINSLAASQ